MWVSNSTVSGPLTSTGAVNLRLCGDTLKAAVTISASTGYVTVGDSDGDAMPTCAGNSIAGPLRVSGNTAGFELGHNKISGPVTVNSNTGLGPGSDSSPEIGGNASSSGLTCSANLPAPTDDGVANQFQSVSGCPGVSG